MIERADRGQRGHLRRVGPAARRHVRHRRERTLARARASASPTTWRKPGDVAQADADRALLDGAQPLGAGHVDGPHAHAAPPRVGHQRRRMIKAHRPVVEQRREERGGMVRLQVAAGVDEQREAGGVALGKSVERERLDAEDDLLLRLAGDAALAHAGAQLRLDGAHALDRALEAHRAAQLLGLAAGEAGRHHRHAHQLLLKQRHAERALEDRLQRRVRIGRPARARRAASRYGCTICPTIGPGRMIATSTTRS